MTAPNSDFLRIAKERGYIHQTTDEAALDAALMKGGLVAYIGYDCTADSLHVGHLLPTMLLRLLQRTGGRPIALIGGGTTKVGDPSGKDEARQLLTEATIEANKAGIRRTFEALLDFDAGAMMLDNAEWLDALHYIPFLRDVGRHFSVNRMLTMDSVRLRLERDQPLSFLEFNYMLLQSYDYLELHRRHGAVLQMGGSDQWGNIVLGADLIRRMAGGEAHAVTTHLLTTASGQKMGKTAAGAVWLNPDRLSPYDYWQFWRDTEDADVARFLALFTELPMAEVRRLGALAGAEVNEAKNVLATEATALLHGRAAAEAAAQSAAAIFAAARDSVRASDGLEAIVTRGGIEVFQTNLPAQVLDLLVFTRLVTSKGEGRRLIANSGVYVNNVPVGTVEQVVSRDDVQDTVVRISIGKKRHAFIRPN